MLSPLSKSLVRPFQSRQVDDTFFGRFIPDDDCQRRNEEKAFRRYHNAWGDGFGGVCWMAGTCVNGWYIHTEPNGVVANCRQGDQVGEAGHERWMGF